MAYGGLTFLDTGCPVQNVDHDYWVEIINTLNILH